MPRWKLQCAVLAAIALACSAPYESAASFNSSLMPYTHHVQAAPTACGRHDWAKKTGTDTDARRVKTRAVKRTNMAYLLSFRPPGKLPAKHRKSPAETTVWSISALLVRYKLNSDRDFTLVIHDDEGRTMIADIPDPQCVARTSHFAAAIKRVRSAFAARFHVKKTSQVADIFIRIEGVGFFDSERGQSGAAINDIQLHPVLGITFLETPEPTETPTAVSTLGPAETPTAVPTVGPTKTPTAVPTVGLTETPTVTPVITPVQESSVTPIAVPSSTETPDPTETLSPTVTLVVTTSKG